MGLRSGAESLGRTRRVAKCHHYRNELNLQRKSRDKGMKPGTWTMRPGDNDKPLSDVVAGILRASRSRAAAAIHQGRVRVQGQVCRQPGRLVRAGQHVNVTTGDNSLVDRKGVKRPKPFRQRPSADGPKPRIVYQDADLLVVDKPA